jgi:hypothetical protein
MEAEVAVIVEGEGFDAAQVEEALKKVGSDVEREEPRRGLDGLAGGVSWLFGFKDTIETVANALVKLSEQIGRGATVKIQVGKQTVVVENLRRKDVIELLRVAQRGAR